MNKTLVKCALLGGLAVFVWGMVSWMALPWHQKTMLPFKNESRVAEVIKDNAMEDGMYVMPYFFSDSEDVRMRMEHGPFIFASIRPNGMGKCCTANYITGAITQIVLAGLATWLLMRTKGLRYMQQASFVMAVGVFAGIATYIPGWNWMGFPVGYTMVSIVDLAAGWFIGGLVIAQFNKR